MKMERYDGMVRACMVAGLMERCCRVVRWRSGWQPWWNGIWMAAVEGGGRDGVVGVKVDDESCGPLGGDNGW